MPKGIYQHKKGRVAWNRGIKTGLKPWLGKRRYDMLGDNNPAKREDVKKRIKEAKIGIPHFNQRGKNSGNWKGGITPINEKIRGSLEMKLWRRAVFERDKYTCIWCGTRSGGGKAIILHADHIKPFALYPELRFAIDNGRTLCIECHKKTLTYGGKII